MTNTNKTPIDILVEKGYDDVIIFSCPDYTDALIGLTDDYNAVYDYSLMIDWLIEHEGMDEEESADFISYNDSFGYGEHYPVIYLLWWRFWRNDWRRKRRLRTFGLYKIGRSAN